MRRAKLELSAEAEHERLTQLLALHEIALGAMSHGLCMYDAARRLVLFNQRLLDHYDLAPTDLWAGMPMRLVFKCAAERLGLTHKQIDAAWKQRQKDLKAGKPFSSQHALPNARIIDVNFRPLAAGGWVALYEDVTERERLAKEVRLHSERVEQAVSSMLHGLAMFDADERLILCNDQYLRLYDLDPAVVTSGVTYRRIIEHSLERGNQPGAKADDFYRERLTIIGSGKPLTMQVVRNDGRIIEGSGRLTPDGGWITVHEDVTERLRHEQALREQNVRFDAALNNMSQGLCMFDAEQRLIVRNEKYLAIFKTDPAVIKPGITLREVFEHAIARGIYKGVTVEELVSSRLEVLTAKQPISCDQQLADGRTIAAEIRPMANGGWVGTFEDVTEKRRLEAERIAALESLREQHHRFNAALDHMSHGLLMLDENLKVIACNRRYLDIFCLSPEMVLPGTPIRAVMAHSIAAGNHPAKTIDELYAGYLQRLSGGVIALDRRMADGRMIHIEHRRMVHGGWVATYEDITERRESEERISHMARHDALTGLPNRVLFREKMDEGLARVQAGGESMAVLCLDLDNFKAVNDTLGHPVGDRLLSTVAQRLICVVGKGDCIARLGGDEFAILQSGPQPRSAQSLGRRIVQVLDQPIIIDGHEINTGTSVGIAVAPTDGTTADHLIKCADLALYRAKAEGRARFRFFEPDMDTRLREKRALEIDLRRALAAGEFELFYQPQIRARDCALAGMEALLRWNHCVRGAVPPAEFIPLAEETGLIVPLGEWILRRACAEAARWPASVKVAVNLSPAQFKSRGLVGMVANTLAATRLAPNRLELEITEAVLLQDDNVTRAMLHQLRALGVRISMDDFGTGYSSLSYLRSFPFDKIKIDRSFVADLDRGKDSAAIIRAVAGLGASLGVETTAEGVETAEQFERVRRDGCTEVQGYYFSPPRPAAEVLALIDGWQRGKAVA